MIRSPFADLVRGMLGVVALGLLALAAAMIGMGRPGFLAPLIWGGVLLVGVVFERWRYKRVERSAGAGFVATGERFVDPTSDEPVRVWADPTTGERRYVRDTEG